MQITSFLFNFQAAQSPEVRFPAFAWLRPGGQFPEFSRAKVGGVPANLSICGVPLGFSSRNLIRVKFVIRFDSCQLVTFKNPLIPGGPQVNNSNYCYIFSSGCLLLLNCFELSSKYFPYYQKLFYHHLSTNATLFGQKVFD